jgi:hypothetical protein
MRWISLALALCLDCDGGGHTQGATGGAESTGGATGLGGDDDTRGSASSGGASGTGGVVGSGGASAAGGLTGSGGASSTDGATGGGSGAGGVTNKGGSSATGGTSGGSGGTSATGGMFAGESNAVQVVLDEGPDNVGHVNGLFVTVTLCVPGTATCQSIDHVLVDTGSIGLRVLESVLTPSFPAIKNATGDALAECVQFVDGTAWGPIVKADVTLAGETALAIPIQAIGENAYPMPTNGLCATGRPMTDPQSLFANGLK